jgi:hypothetical protein
MRKILFPLFIIFFGIILAVLACFSLFTGIQKNSQDYVAQREAIANLEANFENQKNLKSVLQDYELNFKKFENFFIEQDAPIEFFEFLENKAKHCSLSIEISSSSVEESEEKNKYLNLQIKLKGNEQNFLRFLEQIENSDYLIEVIGLNLRKADKENSGTITALLTIKTPVE